MPLGQLRAYLNDLRPYFKISLTFFAMGIVIGAIMVNRVPGLAEYFQDSVANFVRTFRGMPGIQLVAAIFFNNAFKTLAAILLGWLIGIIPAVFLLTNGVALGLVLSLSAQTLGPWLSILSILPHGIIELPAVFLGTSIGLLIGAHSVKKLFKKAPAAPLAETIRGLRFFCTVIVPLLFVAAVVEVFFTGPLIGAR